VGFTLKMLLRHAEAQVGRSRCSARRNEDLDQFRGEILGLNGGADFYGKNPKELRAEFKKSLEIFIAVCGEKGIEPRRNYSGKFNLRIPPALHARLAMAAQAEGKSINSIAQEALQTRVAS